MKRMIIYAMSRRLRDIGADLDSKGQKLIDHLIKLYLYPNSKDVNHWKQEVYNFIHCVDSIKGKHKTPSASFIYDNIYGKYNINYTNNSINATLDDYGDPEFDFDYNDIHQFISEYVEWLSVELNQKEVLSRKSIYTKLDLMMESR